MKKYGILFMALLLVSVPCVMAGTGGLRISETWPVMVESPSTFTVWAQSAEAYDVNILLVITQECLDNMGSGVTLNFGSTPITVTSFEAADDQFVPESGTTNGARYTVASLKDHLDYGLPEPLDKDDTIYFALVPLVGFTNPLTTDPVEIEISLDSTSPRMLIYLLGKSTSDCDLLDMKVPPTIPGFMVPEVAIGSIMTVSTMFAALGLFAYRKKIQH
jgi:hypothetical protein